MDYSNSYIIELLNDVFGQGTETKPIINIKLKGIIPDISLKLNGVIKPNNYSITYVKDILYSDSGKDRNISLGCEGQDPDCKLFLKEGTTLYRPLLNKQSVYTSDKGSFNITPLNTDYKLVINTPVVEDRNFCTGPKNISEYTVCEVSNNTHLFFIDKETKITEKFFREVNEEQIVFSTDTEHSTQVPFSMQAVNREQNSVNLLFQNDLKTNILNEPYQIANLKVYPSEEGSKRPYIKYNDIWHGETNFDKTINVTTKESAESRKITDEIEINKDNFIEFGEFAPYAQYTNYQDNHAKTPIVQAIISSCDSSNVDSSKHHVKYTAEDSKIHIDHKITATANVKASITNLPTSSPGCTEQLVELVARDNTICMTSGNLTVCPCDGIRPYIWQADENQDLKPLGHTECPINNILTVSSIETPARDNLWKISDEELRKAGDGPFVSYLLFKDFIIDTECKDGICDAKEQIAESKLIPGWITINEKTDRHGIHYSSNDLSIETLNANSAFNPGTTIMDVVEYCNDNLRLKLVRLENQYNPIIFNRNVYDVYTHEQISTEKINITCGLGNGAGRQALYIISKLIDNDQHTITTNLTERFMFTNFNHTPGVLFSAENIPFEELMGEHPMYIVNCSNCTVF